MWEGHIHTNSTKDNMSSIRSKLVSSTKVSDLFPDLNMRLGGSAHTMQHVCKLLPPIRVKVPLWNMMLSAPISEHSIFLFV